MIRVKDLHKYFKGFHALKGVEMHVQNGEIYGFIGHNGAGKSTTLNILAGLSHPTHGQCIVNGKDITEIAYPGALQIGYLPEDPRFYPWMTASEVLEYLGDKIDRVRIAEILHWVGLTSDASRRVGGFSRGMKQRLGIGAALIKNPSLLILDEPSSALDPEGRSDVLRLITELKQMGKTVLFSTHILSDVERICDTVGMIADGNMILEKPLWVLQRDHIRPVFDITLGIPWSPDIITKLQNLEGVIEVTLSGNTIAVTALDETQVSHNLLRFFAKHHVAVQSLALRKNDLEELFIKEMRSR